MGHGSQRYACSSSVSVVHSDRKDMLEAESKRVRFVYAQRPDLDRISGKVSRLDDI